VDGFRFDLASILGRGRDGSVLANPPLLERIAADPVLAHTKLIAEAWDAAGLYQVGSFPSWGRWAEWNGRYRDEVRRFVKGDPGMVPLLATRLSGSPDLYRGSGRAPYHSINFVTSHDGFTLADLVSYNRKHNETNGEANSDGSDHNDSWNCGEEGETSSPGVLALRRRQIKNFAALLLVSQGVPMLLGGDELGRTQRGNNNAYCQDNDVSWVDWSLRERNADLFRFLRLMIAFRKSHPALRRRTFFEDGSAGPPTVVWHGQKLERPDWSRESRSLAMHLPGLEGDDDIFVIANAHWEAHVFELPRIPGTRRWRLFVDTTLPPPGDIAERGAEQLVPGRSYPVGPRAVVILIGR
jgi:glycogen operon protein